MTGVVASHWPLAMHIHSAQAIYELRSSDRLLLFTSISFDAAAEQWMVPLYSGGGIVLRGQNDLEIGKIERFVKEKKATVLYLPPAYLTQLTDALGHKGYLYEFASSEVKPGVMKGMRGFRKY